MTQSNVSNNGFSSNHNCNPQIYVACLASSEYASISDVHDMALFIKEHGDLGSELVAHLGDLESARNALENNYHGEHYSELLTVRSN